MNREELKRTKTQLALALAQGTSVTAWARARDVPRPTVYRWASDPEVRCEVESHRRQAVDRAVGQLARLTPWAVGRIAELADSAESESVQLRSLWAIFADMMAASKYTRLEDRVARLEEQLLEQAER